MAAKIIMACSGARLFYIVAQEGTLLSLEKRG